MPGRMKLELGAEEGATRPVAGCCVLSTWVGALEELHSELSVRIQPVGEPIAAGMTRYLSPSFLTT